MKKSLLKTSLREIRSSFGRFIAILAIVALGVGFFAGLMVSEEAMLKTGETYLDEQNFYDFRLMSTLGFDDDDVAALRDADEVTAADGAYQVDALVSDGGDEEKVGRFHSITEDVNKLALKDGRLPENAGECVVDSSFFEGAGIGDTVTIADGNSQDTLDALENHELKIVGVVESPLYMRMGRYSSEIGSGEVEAIYFVPADAFTSEYYTEMYLSVNTSGGLYSDEYDDCIDDTEPDVTKVAEGSVNTRYQEIVDEINDGRKEAQEGIDKANDALELAEKAGAPESQLEEIRAQRDEAQEVLDDLTIPEAPELYVLTRDEDVGFQFFKSDSAIVSSIAKVFPVFFFLVAALVCVTTMTRMMNEQRTQIGVLKSMGYSNASILMKYMTYSGSSGIIGCLLGYFLGTWGFPTIIWSAYRTYYALPDQVLYVFNWQLLLISLAVTLLCTIGVTWICGRSALTQSAAELIRPKAPKAGKRNLFERVTPVWKRLSFLQKITVRNLFRYKARFFMMILGIGGCTALIVTALALQDNFMGVSDLQYNEIDLYDANASFNESLSQEDMDAFLDANGERVAGALFTYTGNMDISANGTTHSVSMNAPIAGGDLGDFFSWHADGTEYSLPEDGELLLDRGLADRLGVQTGDKVTVRDSDMHETTLKICGVYDNYISNNAYISRGTLENAFGKTDVNSAFINFKGDEDVHEQAAALMNADDNITNVTIAADNQSMFTDMLDSLNIIVIVVILCAGALAFIVLYNLTNINISERIREIATLKVLGFYSNEANAYVFRENTALTVFGALAGLVLGKFFHAFVMAQIVVDGLSFDAYVTPQNYAIAFALTIVFAFITQLIMRRKISRIHMAESLKSVE